MFATSVFNSCQLVSISGYADLICFAVEKPPVIVVRRLNNSKLPNGSKPEDICLACGLCCNGVIFADLNPRPEDTSSPFAALQSSVATGGTGFIETGSAERRLVPQGAGRSSFVIAQSQKRIPQPCIAFDGCKCRIYQQRPRHCRDF